MMGIATGLALGSGAWAGVLGAAGFVLGHLLDARNAELIGTAIDAPPGPLTIPSVEEAATSMQVRDVCTLLIEIARADTAVSRLEMRAIRSWLDETFPRHHLAIPEFLKAAIGAPNESIAVLCERLRDAEGGPTHRELLDALYALAETDGALNIDERAALRQAAAALGLSPRREPEDPPEPAWDPAVHLSALGLPLEATNEEITSAYRKLAREHHPDRVAHGPRQAIDEATTRFRAIHDAYEALRERRGF
jgi:DnaJ like chaperone protein